ncbi:MAG TPA: SCO family protein [Rhizomicrobium sp.]|nr:SCO family protein [Rhizomicrobium sp.]
MFRNRQILVPYLLLVAALAGVLLWHQSRNSDEELGRVVSTGTTMVGGNFTLTGHTGRKASSSEFRGRYQLIYFGFTMCPDVCPTTLAVMADALDKLGERRKRIVPILITIDPERDTPKVMAQYVKSFGDDFIGFTGSVAEIEAVKKLYRVYGAKKALDEEKGLAGGYGMDHSSVMYLMGPDGKLVSYYDELIPADKLEAELRAKVK